jgi:uncharacterized membrane protein YgaE (UPF0421/DUF939 family)
LPKAWRGYALVVRIAGSLRVTARTPLVQVLKTSVAAILSWLICVIALDQPLPIFAAIAALLVVQPSVSQSLSRGIERSLGVVAGVVLAFGIGILFGTSTWIVLSVVVLALLLAWFFKLSPGSSNQIPISAMLVLSIGGLTPTYALNRVIETVIGAAIGLLVNAAIVPPVLLAPAHGAVQRLLRDCAACLDLIAQNLSSPQTPEALDELLTRARALRGSQVASQTAILAGEDSLTMNPRRGRHRRILENDKRLYDRLTVLVTRIIGMARAIHDNYDSRLSEDRTVQGIARELSRAAHDLRLLGRDVEGSGTATSQADELALTAPLSVVTPNPTNWILIGSLLEDMRRVREEIVGNGER